MVRESTAEEVANAILLGILDLINPVMTSTLGRCVATIKWIPAARASCVTVSYTHLYGSDPSRYKIHIASLQTIQ